MYINKMVESQNDSGAIVNETISKVINFKKLRLKRNRLHGNLLYSLLLKCEKRGVRT